MNCISLNTYSEPSNFIGTAPIFFIDFWDKLRDQKGSQLKNQTGPDMTKSPTGHSWETFDELFIITEIQPPGLQNSRDIFCIILALGNILTCTKDPQTWGYSIQISHQLFLFPLS